MTITALSTATGRAHHPDPGRTRVLWVACGAHALHDGLTDTLYLLLPLWQAQFGNVSSSSPADLRFESGPAGLRLPP
jgi:hypothetical protein